MRSVARQRQSPRDPTQGPARCCANQTLRDDHSNLATDRRRPSPTDRPGRTDRPSPAASPGRPSPTDRPSRTLRTLRTLRAIVLALPLCLALVACKKNSPQSAPPKAGSAAASAAMGTWQEWRDLSPLVEIAETHAPAPTVAALVAASKLLRQGQIQAADRTLAELADSEGRHWIASARADLGAFYFSTCIRGVA
ncbi:MAG TPA: hypothetical protein ENJ18_18295, partial [Nannocystis exedens]|nr:hypothetical protein [Nannocystis exedens]